MSWRVMTPDSMPVTSVRWVTRRVPSRSRLRWTIEVDGRGDLLPDGPGGQVEAGHEHHGLEPGQGVAGRVGVHGRQRALVAGVHGLEHVEGLAAPDLADDDAVGPHAQRVADQVADGDLAPPSMLGGRLSRRTTWSWTSCSSAASSMVTMRSSSGMNDERTLSSVVLPVPVPPVTRMLSRPSTHRLASSASRGVRVLSRTRSSTVQGHLGELADGEGGAVERERRDDGVDPGAVGQAGVDHGRGLVDAAADLADDALDDPPQVVLGQEPGLGGVEPAGPLDVDRPGAVDHDLGDLGVGEEALEGAVAEDVLADLVDAGAGARRARGAPGRPPAPTPSSSIDQPVELLLGHVGPEQPAAEPGEQRLLGPLLDGGERDRRLRRGLSRRRAERPAAGVGGLAASARPAAARVAGRRRRPASGAG